MNVGDRPTFGLNEKLVEAHILSFNGDLYGKKIAVYFKRFLREIKKFDNVLDLKEQIEKDIEYVKGIKI
ncbi:MAG: riboflavin kinase [Clostridia bacterium]|nr:riboflavin kinase [Clostridia bacterium]